MSVDDDGIEQTFEGGLRVAVTVAARIGEQLARIREQQAERARAESEQAARDFAARMNAERTMALGRLEVVKDPKFWDRASVADIAHAHTDARAWAEHDPRAGAAMHRIRDEVQQRYGVDVHEPGADPVAVSEALARGIAERRAGEVYRTDSLALAEATRDPKWWDRAGVDDVTRAYAGARDLAGEDRAAAAAVPRIRDEAQRRYGVDLQDLDAKPEEVRAAMAVKVADRWVEKTSDPKWWDTASARDVAQAYAAVREVWDQPGAPGTEPVVLEEGEPPVEPRMLDERRIRHVVLHRYGVHVADVGADPAALEEALARAEAARRGADEQRGGARADDVDAQNLMRQANSQDRAADAARDRGREANGAHSDVADDRDLTDFVRTEPNGPAGDGGARPEAHEARAAALREAGGVAYDSAERRDGLASHLEGKVDAETLNARMVADRSQGTHPRAAVQSDPYKVAQAPRQPSRGRSRQRSGLER